MNKQVNKQVTDAAIEHLGRAISPALIGLLPKPDKALKSHAGFANLGLSVKPLTNKDRETLLDCETKGWILAGANGVDQLQVSKQFYDAMQEILWIGYLNR